MIGTQHMEPMLPDDRDATRSIIFDLAGAAGSFAGGLNQPMRSPIGDLVRSMDCYYSNQIEGHNTKLIDIEKALADDYSAEPEKRNLQLEARAHIEVQRLIDEGKMPYPAFSVDGIRWIHREFCERLPEEFLVNKDPATGDPIKMVPGELRTHHVMVGRHTAPEPEALEPLLNRWVEAYSSGMLPKDRRILAIAAAHHRLVWIHPFMDGNGRVGRLLSHAMLRDHGVGSEMWSLSRGLAKKVDRYKALLQAADEPRRGALDGRGNLTEQGLSDFCEFFLEQCLDQVRFMQGLIRPAELMNRVKVWADEEVNAKRLPEGSWPLLREAILVGDVPRSRATELTGYQERQARTVLSDLQNAGVLTSSTPKGPVRLAFPSSVVERWFPGLYEPQPAARGENRHPTDSCFGFGDHEIPTS